MSRKSSDEQQQDENDEDDNDDTDDDNDDNDDDDDDDDEETNPAGPATSPRPARSSSPSCPPPPPLRLERALVLEPAIAVESHRLEMHPAALPAAQKRAAHAGGAPWRVGDRPVGQPCASGEHPRNLPPQGARPRRHRKPRREPGGEEYVRCHPAPPAFNFSNRRCISACGTPRRAGAGWGKLVGWLGWPLPTAIAAVIHALFKISTAVFTEGSGDCTVRNAKSRLFLKVRRAEEGG